jgi:hypothetical protein
MAYVEEGSASRRVGLDATMLAGEWRRLRRAATAVALFTSPLFFVVLYDRLKLSLLNRAGGRPQPFVCPSTPLL